MQINKKEAHHTNFSSGRASAIKYLVLHYTANDGDTALNNCNYFAGANRNASAHYFVDEKEVWQSVNDYDVAWHCGSSRGYIHDYCRNNNSIGIEMCSRKDENGIYYIKDETVENALTLVKELMAIYDIPEENVIRHHDVTGKMCPEPFVRVASKWEEFKMSLSKPERFNTINDLPEWAVPIINNLVEQGKIADKNNLDLSMDMLRILVIMGR